MEIRYLHMLYMQKHTHAILKKSVVTLTIAIGAVLCWLHWPTPAIKIISDARSSEHFTREIKKLLEQERGNNPYNIIKKIKHAFPIVKTASYFKQSPHQAIVRICLHSPLLCINKKLVLLDQGTIEDSCWLDNTTQSQLPNIYVRQPAQELGPTILAWLEQCDQELLSTYAIYWDSASQIIIKDKIKKYICLAHYTTPLTDKKIQQGFSLIKLELEKKRLAQENAIIADLRFKDQIVISKNRGDYEREIT